MALIDSKQTEFEGRQVQVFHELILHRAIVAIANVLSINGELPQTSDKKTTYSEEELKTQVATKLSDVEGSQIDDAKERLVRLARRIEVNVNFRRIREFEDFPEQDIFNLLGVPLYHAWKVVPVVADPHGLKTAELEVMAESHPISLQERNFIAKSYHQTKFTSYGYKELTEALNLEKNGLCVVYWCMGFYTIHKKDNELFVLDNSGEWQNLDERMKLRRGINNVRSRIEVTSAGMDDDTFQHLKHAIQIYKKEMPGRKFEFDSYPTLDDVLQHEIRRGYHVDIIAINCNIFYGNPDNRDMVWSWLYELRRSGFIGVVVALAWWWSDMQGGEYDQWVSTDKYIEVDVAGIIWVRGDCLEEKGTFSEHFGPIIQEAVWRREVVYAERLPPNPDSYKFIRSID